MEEFVNLGFAILGVILSDLAIFLWLVRWHVSDFLSGKNRSPDLLDQFSEMNRAIVMIALIIIPLLVIVYTVIFWEYSINIPSFLRWIFFLASCFGLFKLSIVLWRRSNVNTKIAVFTTVTLLGERTGRVLKSGKGFKLFFEEIILTPYPLERKKFPIEFLALGTGVKKTSKKPNLVKVEGEVQLGWRPSPVVLGAKRKLVRFLEMSHEVIEDGIVGTIKNELGDLGGAIVYTALIRKRPIVKLYILSILKLSNDILPHLNPRLYDPTYKDDWVRPEDRIDFYEKHQEKIRELLEESKFTDSFSEVEETYGIEIIRIDLEKLLPDEETIEALEKQEQAKLELEAMEAVHKRTLQFAHEIQDEDPDLKISFEKAYDNAQSNVGTAKKEIKKWDITGLDEILKELGGK